MPRLIRWLLTGSGHEHEWETLWEAELLGEDDKIRGHQFACRCKTCGRIRDFKV